MRNRLATVPADADAGYRARLVLLRARKIEDTQDKRGLRQFADSDDYGTIKAHVKKALEAALA